ncbi:MAG: hypothetical protein KAG34_10200 [Cocleimonas sp.]|nr:hypothetical protein [Cocleimonas sp.]
MKKLLNIGLLPIVILSFSLSVYADTKTEQPATATASSTSSLSAEQSILKEADQLWADKKIDEAIAAYKKIIAEHPDNKHTYQRLASLYLLNNKASSAIPAYQDAIIHDPQNAKLFASMSIAYLHLGKYAMAKAMANEAVTLDPAMENAKKIISYADRKVEILKQAAKADQAKMPTHDAAFLKKGMDATEKPASASLPK